MAKLIVDSTQKIKEGRKEIEWKRGKIHAERENTEAGGYTYINFHRKREMQSLKQPDYYRTCSFPGFSGMMFPGKWPSASFLQ